MASCSNAETRVGNRISSRVRERGEMARWNVRNSYNSGRAQLVRAGNPAGSCLCARSVTLTRMCSSATLNRQESTFHPALPGCGGAVMRWRCWTDVNGATHFLRPPLPGLAWGSRMFDFITCLSNCSPLSPTLPLQNPNKSTSTSIPVPLLRRGVSFVQQIARVQAHLPHTTSLRTARGGCVIIVV